ncbi:unnamed protein product, partial [Ectocarpus sp. 12 AP-2014]
MAKQEVVRGFGDGRGERTFMCVSCLSRKTSLIFSHRLLAASSCKGDMQLQLATHTTQFLKFIHQSQQQSAHTSGVAWIAACMSSCLFRAAFPTSSSPHVPLWPHLTPSLG